MSFRCKKVYDGVTHAGKLYPNAYLIMIIIGTLKGQFSITEIRKYNKGYNNKWIGNKSKIITKLLTGNGAGFTKLFERLIRGVWMPSAMEFMQPSLYVVNNHS